MTLEEERQFYNEVLDRVIANPRYYLDHLEDDKLAVFKCSFIDYYHKVKKKSKPL